MNVIKNIYEQKTNRKPKDKTKKKKKKKEEEQDNPADVQDNNVLTKYVINDQNKYHYVHI
jgi:hypothetical protein